MTQNRPPLSHPWHVAAQFESAQARLRREQYGEPVRSVLLKRKARIWRDEERVPDVADDREGFMAWRLSLVRSIAKRLMREMHGDEREDLAELQLEAGK